MRLATQDLYVAFNKFFDFFAIPAYQPINLKAKNNSFFHRYRVKNLNYMRRIQQKKDWNNKEKVISSKIKNFNVLKVIVFKVLI